MDCEQLAERLTDFLQGDLEEAEEQAAIEHLATCHACETVLSRTRDVMEAARDHGRLPLSDGDQARLWERISGDIIADSD